jgi:hypothetical protein
MNPVDYTLNLQRITALVAGASFLGLSAILTFLNPYEGVFNFWLFLFALFVFVSCSIVLVSFWWVFGVQKQILMVGQVNQLLYQSLVSSAFLMLAFILNHTQNLSLTNFLILLGVYLMYCYWSSL